MKNYIKNTGLNSGFTLIELLTVIAIISLLSSVILSQLNTARVKARDAVRIHDLQQIQKALELYYDENGGYPIVVNAASNGLSGNKAAWANLEIKLSPYIPRLPEDPLMDDNIYTGSFVYWLFDANKTYSYSSGEGGNNTKYDLMGHLETDHPLTCGQIAPRVYPSHPSSSGWGVANLCTGPRVYSPNLNP